MIPHTLRICINAKNFGSQTPRERDAEILGNVNGERRRHGFYKDNGNFHAANFGNHFGGTTPAEYQNFIAEKNFLTESRTVNFIEDVMPSDVLAENQNLFVVK